jgi:hypothetical protein
MSGAKLAILYGLVPNRLGLCGPEDRMKKKIISRFLGGEKKLESEIKKILKDFKGAYPYYQLIARSNKINNPLSEKAVEAYWTGNNLLEKVPVSEFKKMMKNEFLPLGKMSKERIEKLPQLAFPFHNFHVLFIGSVTGRFKETKKGLDLCRISWGEVVKTDKNKITVWREPIKFGKKLTLGKPIDRVISWDKRIVPSLKKGDWLSIHWNSAVEKLDKEKLKNIIKYTNEALKIINRSRY